MSTPTTDPAWLAELREEMASAVTEAMIDVQFVDRSPDTFADAAHIITAAAVQVAAWALMNGALAETGAPAEVFWAQGIRAASRHVADQGDESTTVENFFMLAGVPRYLKELSEQVLDGAVDVGKYLR